MKKVLSVIVFALLFTTASQAQFKIGANIGVPVGNLSGVYSLSWGIDTYYMLGDPNAFLKLGINASFLNYVGDEAEFAGQTFEIDNVQFIPLAGALRITLFDILTLGPDVGYAIGLGDAGNAFYLKSVIGIDIANSVEINTFYQRISEGDAFGSIGAGILFEF